MNKGIKNALTISITFTLLDQLTKKVAEHYFIEGKSLLPGLLSFDLQHNYGVAFSIAIPVALIFVANFILLIGGAWLASKELDFRFVKTQVLMGLILGGAIGNIIDRSLYGYVIDFISIWIWPVFNLADMGIVIGILGIFAFYGKIKKNKNA